jgi:hypothetical protein
MQNTVKTGLSRRKFLYGSAAALAAPLRACGGRV